MNRTTVIAVVAAAVVGFGGGAVTAVVRGDADPSSTGTPTKPAAASPKPSSSATPSASQAALDELLWAEPGVVHDGPQRIELAGTPAQVPDRLVRAKDGYVLAFEVLDDSRRFVSLHFLRPDGDIVHLGNSRGAWDLNAAGDRVAFIRQGDGVLATTDVGGDGPVTSWAGPQGRVGSLVWTGGEVIVHSLERGAETWQVDAWTPATGEVRTVGHQGFEGAVSTRDGGAVFGRVASNGVAGDGENICLAKDTAPGESGRTWMTCDWRTNSLERNPVSPDGRRLLVVSTESDGFGPVSFGIMGVESGPPGGVPTFNIPAEWALDAAWVTDDRYAVSGSNNDDPGTTGGWVQLCDLTGDCDQVARTTTGRVVLGEPF